MASREAWCSEMLSKLLNEDLRISALTEIKEYISTLSNAEINEIANSLQLPMVFDCLNDSKSEQIDLACEILTMCMSTLSLGESTNKYATSLERALYHPSHSVKTMALKEIHRNASNAESVSDVHKHMSLLVALVVCVGDSDLSVAKKAADILVLIGKNESGLQMLLNPKIKDVFAQTISISDVVRFRIYEIVVDIGCSSEHSLQGILSTGLIHSLLSELDSNDFLLKLNVLELVSNLIAPNHGLKFLEEQNIITKIMLMLVQVSQDPMAAIILPGLLKFFGNVTYWIPNEIFDRYSAAFLILFDCVASDDLTLLGVAYDTLGHIASTSDGKFTLQLSETHLIRSLKMIGVKLPSLTNELRVRALNCIENLIRVRPGEQNNRVCLLVQNWFGAIHSDLLSVVYKYAQNPFMDIRCAGLGILQAMAEQTWGQVRIRNHPGLIEFLLDRRIETSKESKEMKYEIVKSLSAASAVFSESTLLRFAQYVREGPFYVEAITEVAIEGIS